jgi:hypothetical protein
MTATVKQAILLDGHDSPPIIETANVAGGESFCRYHWLTSQTSVPVTVGLYTWPDEAGITVTYTSTITESSSYADYVIDSQRLVGLYVGLTLNNLLAKDLEYTVHVLSEPVGPPPVDGYAPNINIWVTNGINTYIVQAWGSNINWVTGSNTVTFAELMDGTNGYGATVNAALGAASPVSEYDASAHALTDLLSNYGTWNAFFVEVRAQAGAAGGQVLRPVQFKAAGITIEVPDSDTFTILILQPGEFLPFYICYKFDLLIEAGTYDIYTTVKPYP